VARYILLALNGPTEGEGHDEEYNTWYSEVHVKDLLATPGIESAERYKVVQGNGSWPYVAVYQIEADDLGTVFQALGETASTFPDVFDRSNSAHIVAINMDDLETAD